MQLQFLKKLSILFTLSFFTMIQIDVKSAPKHYEVDKVQNEVNRILDINMRQTESCAQCAHMDKGSKKAAALPKLTADFKDEGANCSAFIDDNGKYGVVGNTIKDYLKDPRAEIYFRDSLAGMSTAQKVCPKWSSLSRDEKVHFWVWTFASMAWDEARCKPNAVNPKATNGVGVGLFQLEQKRSSRHWRGPHCKKNSVIAAVDNTQCAMDMMGEILKGKDGMHKTNGRIYQSSNSYWQKLRQPSGGNIGRLMRQNPLCK